ncbi:MAG: hypothetical protein MJZ03_05415 [archaeon]|nr:hypothetical protein [archaeon]
MKIMYDDLKVELNELVDMVDGFGNAGLSHHEKKALSDRLAETAQMIRFKYEITSGYYAPSEYEAVKKINKILEAKTMNDRMQINLLDENETFTAHWYIDEHGNLRCSRCNGAGGMTRGNTNYIPNPTRFCPHCGNRMKNGN